MSKFKPYYRALAVTLFIASGVAGVGVFWLMVEFANWMQVSEYMALMLISLAWVALFVVWLLTFLLTMVLLNSLGIGDPHSL